MANTFRLQLLGPVQIERNGKPLQGFKSRKTLALLGYLASQSQKISRGYLVNLFWPDKSETRGRNNLSQVVHSISTLCPDCLKVDRYTVQFHLTADHWLDIRVFNELVARGEAESLAMAATLYQDDFMTGMYLDDCPEFEQWLRIEQETWRRRVTQVLQDLIAYYMACNELDQALAFASRLIAIDPWQEEGHRQLMLLLAQSGQRSAALAQYETCCRLLAEELGIEPAPETMKVYEQIRGGELGQETGSINNKEKLSSIFLPIHNPAPLSYNNLPAQSTSFIGRETELAMISKYLADPDCRLLTIAGLGGIGKTRLALQAAAATEKFSHGVCFIPLTFTHSTEFLLSTITDMLNFPIYGPGDPKVQLLNYLSDKEMLLVMDNFEHLLPGANLLVEILQRAPRIKILVTSRERLGVPEEWVLDLQGLPFPGSEQSSNIETYGAVQLFLQRAQQARAGFWLSYLDKPAVAHVCRLVEGLPLGIELAAAWTRTLSCQEIAAEIQKNYDFLTTSLQNIPKRHQSLQAVFEHSWKLLSEEERRVFRKLTVFRGGFTRKSAEQVVGASAFSLSTLVDKSLLRWTPVGRYEMHELLRQYGAKKLAEATGKKEKVKNQHCKHYAEFLHQQEARLKRGKQKEALAVIGLEIDNVRAGWYWAVAHGIEEDFEKYREALFLIHNMQSWFQEGEAVFRYAAASLYRSKKRGGNFDRKIDKMLGQVLARQGVFCASLGHYEKARAILQEGLMFQDPDTRQSSPLSLTYLGAIAWALGDYAQAKQLCQESLAIIQKSKDRWKEALTLQYLGMIAVSQGEYVEAKELAYRSLATFRQFGYRSGIAFALNILGIAARNLGEYAYAKQFCQESLIIAREIGDRWEEALSLEYLGMIAISLGQYSEAKDLAQKSLAIFKEFDYSSGTTFCLNMLGIVARNLGQYEEAKRLHQEVLETCQSLDYQLGIALASYYLGHTVYLLGDHAEAERLLTESLTISKKLTYQRGVTRSLSTLGNVARAMGKYQQAQKYLYEALKMTQEIYSAPMALDVLAGLANLLTEEGKTERAIELLTVSRSHAATEKETKDKADRLFAELASELPNQVLETAQERGKAETLEEMVEEILSETADEDLVLVCGKISDTFA